MLSFFDGLGECCSPSRIRRDTTVAERQQPPPPVDRARHYTLQNPQKRRGFGEVPLEHMVPPLKTRPDPYSAPRVLAPSDSMFVHYKAAGQRTPLVLDSRNTQINIQPTRPLSTSPPLSQQVPLHRSVTASAPAPAPMNAERELLSAVSSLQQEDPEDRPQGPLSRLEERLWESSTPLRYAGSAPPVSAQRYTSFQPASRPPPTPSSTLRPPPQTVPEEGSLPSSRPDSNFIIECDLVAEEPEKKHEEDRAVDPAKARDFITKAPLRDSFLERSRTAAQATAATTPGPSGSIKWA